LLISNLSFGLRTNLHAVKSSGIQTFHKEHTISSQLMSDLHGSQKRLQCSGICSRCLMEFFRIKI
jgi:hypothetical protein